jgi:predicted PurR-regulated permease PerM
MADPRLAYDKAQINQALETAIHIGLTALLVIACLLILKPFLPLIIWGIIIAVATYPGFLKLQSLLRGRGVWAAVLVTLVFLAILIIPTILLGQSLVGAIETLTAHVRGGAAIIPPPPESIASWPIIGASLHSLWSRASRDLSAVIMQFAPQIKAVLPGVLSASAGVGFTVLQLVLAILVSGVLLANAEACHQATRSLTIRVFDEKGPEFQELIAATIRSVTFGILGVAVIQTFFAAIGFFVVGLPGASLWTVIFLFTAVLQMGMLTLIPAVIYVFATANSTTAVIFLIWCIIVGLMDNVLKPILLGRGVAVPIAVVFLGSIGGFVAMGIVGLFVGAIVLSVGYKLFLAWLDV